MRIKSVFYVVVIACMLCQGAAGQNTIIKYNGIKPDQKIEDDIIIDSRVQQIEYKYSGKGLDLSDFNYMALDIHNKGLSELVVDLVYNGPWANHVNQGRFIIPVGKKEQVRLVLNRQKLDPSSDWLPTFKNERGLPGGYVRHWNAFDLKEIKKVTITLRSNQLNHKVLVSSPYGTKPFEFNALSYATQPKPMIDIMGQYIGADWEGKLGAENELHKLGKEDRNVYEKHPVRIQYSQYGGWKDGPKQEAKGHFYTKKVKGKWWLVDPEGYLFWSQGVTGVGGSSATSFEGREELFPEFNAKEFGNEWSNLKHGIKNGQVDFYKMNLARKYGNDWITTHNKVTIGRMKAWGLNTCGAWSPVAAGKEHPYTLIIHPAKQGIGKITKMVDPFSEEFHRDLKMRLGFVKKYKGDPWNMGIFVNNELHWRDEMAIPNQVINLKNGIAARKAFEDQLRNKYKKIKKLNLAWDSNFKSFTAINSEGSKQFKEAFKEDMLAYIDLFADTYYRTVAEEFRKAMPNHLYLGSRLHDKAKYNPIVQKAASRYCDVISFNIYQCSVEDFKVYTDVDKPFIIGEFHFGTGTHGVWGTGLRSASDLDNQSDLYKQYLNEALVHPLCVGAHWFQWSDQPATGRGSDGENFRIGLVSVTDQPYEPMVEVIKEIADERYVIRSAE